MTKYVFLLFCLFIAFSSFAKCDSPLTSTPFYKAYEDIEIVKYALIKGEPDKKIAEYFASKANPSDIKAAVVNALGWSTESKRNAETYLMILKKRYPGLDESPESLRTFLTTDEIFCFTYMDALDNYINPVNSIVYVDYLLNTDKENFVYAMVGGLIKSQLLIKSNWCGIWNNYEEVIRNEKLDFRMRIKAIYIISDYIVLYKKDCREMSD